MPDARSGAAAPRAHPVESFAIGRVKAGQGRLRAPDRNHTRAPLRFRAAIPAPVAATAAGRPAAPARLGRGWHARARTSTGAPRDVVLHGRRRLFGPATRGYAVRAGGSGRNRAERRRSGRATAPRQRAASRIGARPWRATGLRRAGAARSGPSATATSSARLIACFPMLFAGPGPLSGPSARGTTARPFLLSFLRLNEPI